LSKDDRDQRLWRIRALRLLGLLLLFPFLFLQLVLRLGGERFGGKRLGGGDFRAFGLFPVA